MKVRIEHHKQLVVWERAMTLAVNLYKATRTFPSSERFGLTSQIRRSAVSIPANISEGAARVSSGEFARFVCIARGSVAELETHIELSNRLGLLPEANDLLQEVAGIGKMLVKLHRTLAQRAGSRPPPS